MTTQVEAENTSNTDRVLRGTKIGLVTRAKSQKTRVVTVEYQVRHSKYGKYLKRETNYHVHDPKDESGLGDRVEIASCRPISKTKSWRLVKIIDRGQGGDEHTTSAKID